MTCNESDDKKELQSEIRDLEQRMTNLDNKLYEIQMQKKFIRHRLDDWYYQMRTGIDPRAY